MEECWLCVETIQKMQKCEKFKETVRVILLFSKKKESKYDSKIIA